MNIRPRLHKRTCSQQERLLQFREPKPVRKAPRELKSILDFKPIMSDKYVYVSRSPSPNSHNNNNESFLPILKPEYRGNISRDELLTSFDRIMHEKSPTRSFKSILRTRQASSDLSSFLNVGSVTNAMKNLRDNKTSFEKKYRKLFVSRDASPVMNKARQQLAEIKTPHNMAYEKKFFKSVSRIIGDPNTSK